MTACCLKQASTDGSEFISTGYEAGDVSGGGTKGEHTN